MTGKYRSRLKSSYIMFYPRQSFGKVMKRRPIEHEAGWLSSRSGYEVGEQKEQPFYTEIKSYIALKLQSLYIPFPGAAHLF